MHEKNKQNRVLKVICNTDHAMLSIIHTDITQTSRHTLYLRTLHVNFNTSSVRPRYTSSYA